MGLPGLPQIYSLAVPTEQGSAASLTPRGSDWLPVLQRAHKGKYSETLSYGSSQSSASTNFRKPKCLPHPSPTQARNRSLHGILLTDMPCLHLLAFESSHLTVSSVLTSSSCLAIMTLSSGIHSSSFCRCFPLLDSILSQPPPFRLTISSDATPVRFPILQTNS